MLKLQNNTNIDVKVYIGHFDADNLDANFLATRIITLAYSEFMAWLYLGCDVINYHGTFIFVTSPAIIIKAFETKAEEFNEALIYTSIPV